MIRLDLQSRLPIYEQMRTQISELVLTGSLKPDDQLPSVRNLARDLGINPNTVQKAYQELERDGVIYSVSGRGSYIRPNSDVIARLSEQQLQRVLQEILRAKNCGIAAAQIITLVQEVYQLQKEGGLHDDNNNVADQEI